MLFNEEMFFHRFKKAAENGFEAVDENRPYPPSILESGSINYIGQNIKYDALVLRNAGVNLSNIYFTNCMHKVSKLDEKDIIRHELVKSIIRAYQK